MTGTAKQAKFRYGLKENIVMTSFNGEIANRKNAKKAATKTKDEWERMVDAVPDLIAILDKDYRILRTNRAVVETLKLPMSKLLGRPCYQIFCGRSSVPKISLIEHCKLTNNNALSTLGGEGTVLVIDDDKDQRTIAQQMLTVLGYTVHAVISGEEAVIWLQSNSSDLLLLDMIMDPGMNGRETYEKVLRLNPRQKALVASGLSQDNELQKAFQLGVSDFISKPYTLEELGSSVQKVMKS